MMTTSVGGSGRLIAALIAMAFGAIGFVLALVAPGAFLLLRREGVFGFAVLGLLLNGGLVAIWGVQLVGRPGPPPVAGAPGADPDLDAALDDGWTGGATLPSGVPLTLMQVPKRSVFSAFRNKAEVIMLSIHNGAGTQDIVVNATRASFLLTDGGVMDGPLWADVVAQGPREATRFFNSNSYPLRVDAGVQHDGAVAFAPAGLDFHQVKGVAIEIDGRVLVFSGRVLTRAEKVAAMRGHMPDAQ